MNETEEDVSLSVEELNKLFNIGIALTEEQDLDILLETILTASKEFCKAEGGTLYLMNEKNTQLTFSIIHNDKLGIKMGGISGKQEIPFPSLELYNSETGEPNYSNVATYVALKKEIINIPDAYDSDDFDFSGTRAFDKKSGYRSKSFLTLPLKTRSGEVIAVLQLINARSEFGETVPFSKALQKLIESLGSYVAVVIDNQQLEGSLHKVLEGFLGAIAQAIDNKSPYMGAHCQNVPIIARMLAMEAAMQQDGIFKDFELSENEWYSFHIASWLHDCGKVTTPEYLIDKATKLEAFSNRIHEVRTRFEILRRDAHIDYLKKRLAGHKTPEILLAEFNQRVAQLEKDFKFLGLVNVGDTRLTQNDNDEIQRISKYTYHRHFDKTIGLSRGELDLIKDNMPEKTNPKEPVLEDRAEHHFNGFNRGEIYNLQIPVGTITKEEMAKINEHIVTTIDMLERIQFPSNVRNVVEYAGGHHERMDGAGYPNKLTRKQMSIPARILGIADVFESISSTAKPYKKVKTLHEILDAMSYMAKTGHLDPDLFNLLLTSGVYLDYAKQYMQESQIEEIDIQNYLVPTEDNN